MTQYKTSGVQISYDNNKVEILEENIRALIQSIQNSNLFAGFHVSPPLLLLSSLLNLNDIADEYVVASLVFSVAVDNQENGQIALPSFLDALGMKAKKYLERSHEEFHLIFPLNYDRNKLLVNHFSINHIDFEIVTWDECQKKYDIASLCNRAKDFIHSQQNPIYWHEQSVPLFTKIFGRSPEEAFRRGEKAYEILTGSMNYILDNSITYQFSENKPLAKVLPSVVYGVFSPDGKLVCPYVDTDFINYQTLCNDDMDFSKLQILINLAESSNCLDRRFSQALKSHIEGLETTYWDVAFLSFWRVFEILSFGDSSKYDMNDVVERTSILLGADKKTRDFLSFCASRRNNLVHKGVFSSEGQPLVLTLKIFSKLCLNVFGKLIKNYRTIPMFEQYFALVNSSTEKLVEQKSIIENILKERSS